MEKQIIIPEYTADEYTSSDAPYAWLYAHRNNKFLMRQLMMQMKARASRVGVKGFVASFNAYCETMASGNDSPTGRSSDFDGQPIELMSGGYICDENGVRILDKYGFEEVVCRHPILPVRRLINVDSGEERMEIAYKRGGTWRTLIAEKTAVSSSSRILELSAYGVAVTAENAKLLSTYLFNMEETNYHVIPEKRSVGRLGWIGSHGFSPYLEDLEFDGEASYRHIFGSVRPQGSRERWIEIMKRMRAEKTAGRVFLAASFASAILEPCGLLPFFVHLWGGQGTGKTVSLMIAASVWASPRLGEYITSFNSTDVGQEMISSFLNSLPLCMDELQIQASAGVREFDRMIYKLTEGFGKTRGAKSGGLRQISTWKNCILTTGEFPIVQANSMGGASVRVIQIECEQKVYHDLVDLCAVINENYGFAGREFAEYLQQEGVAERVNAIQKQAYRKLLKVGEDKQAASASAIVAADQIATELFFRDGNALTEEEVAVLLTRRDEVNVNRRALEYIYELVSRNPIHFYPGEFGDYRSEVWGKVDSQHIYFVKSVFDREMQLAGFDATSFLSWAKRNGLLVCDTDRPRRTRKAKVGDSVINTVCLVRSPDCEEGGGTLQHYEVDFAEFGLPE